jgi:hypothetical protein
LSFINPILPETMKQLYPRLCTRRAKSHSTFFAGLFLVFYSLSANAQTTPVNGITTFNTISTGAYIEYANTSNGTAGFSAANVQSSGWNITSYTSGPDDMVIAGENWGPGSTGGFVYVASNNGGASIVSMRFRANDGKLFDLNALDLGYDVDGSNTNFTVRGYRSGVQVAGAQFAVPSFASFGNGGNWRRNINISANSNFKGIDEFRITPNTAGILSALDVDNINATNFRTVTFAQIIPADIPVSNAGPFNKTIAGHSFTFTPCASNYVDYNTDIGSEGYGGLYAYDYTTADGTEITVSAPAGYTFDLSSFQYISDRGAIDLAVTLTFSDNSTDTKNYSLNSSSAVQTFSGFTTAANDVKSIRLVTDVLIYSNNFEVTDIKALSTLPLQWLQFTASKQGGGVVLNWRTTAEQGTRDFLVQHSTDGQNWKNIGTVEASGNNSAEQSYSFVHGMPVKGLNAYRLLQRDVDGRSSYSRIATVNLKADEQFRVYPNPVVNGKLHVELQGADHVRIYNNAGLLMMQKRLPAGISTLNLDTFAKGLYTINVNGHSVLVVVQ